MDAKENKQSISPSFSPLISLHQCMMRDEVSPVELRVGGGFKVSKVSYLFANN